MAKGGKRGAPCCDPHEVRGHDLYETPPEATRALMACERLPERIWEPACGRGAIVNVLRAAGHYVYASDLVGYGTPIGDPYVAGLDFMKEYFPPVGIECIVTNPPYMHANEFVAAALELCPKVVMLLRLGYFEGGSECGNQIRRGNLDGGKLARVHVFRRRLPRMHRDGWEGPKTGSSICFAWYVWEDTHTGDPTFRRIDW